MKIFILIISLGFAAAQQPVLDGCPELCQNRDVHLSNDKVRSFDLHKLSIFNKILQVGWSLVFTCEHSALL